jgi:DDE superfamily endonuclease
MGQIAHAKGIGRDKVEIWFADEARIGQKNKITRRWALRGTRPAAARDQRTASTYIFGAICPTDGKGAALVLPTCNTHAMNLHLTEISASVAPGAHAAILLDQPRPIPKGGLTALAPLAIATPSPLLRCSDPPPMRVRGAGWVPIGSRISPLRAIMALIAPRVR